MRLSKERLRAGSCLGVATLVAIDNAEAIEQFRRGVVGVCGFGQFPEERPVTALSRSPQKVPTTAVSCNRFTRSQSSPSEATANRSLDGPTEEEGSWCNPRATLRWNSSRWRYPYHPFAAVPASPDLRVE